MRRPTLGTRPALAPFTLALVLAAPLAPAGCAPPDEFEEGELTEIGAPGKGDAFDGYTNPIELIKLVNTSPSLRADDLVAMADINREKSVPQNNRPFSSTYWPMADNGILDRWQGATVPSPAEKYGALFLTPEQATNMNSWIQRYHGKDVPGVQDWYGICQGWTASAIAELAPKKPITVRKVMRDGRPYLQNCVTSTTNCVQFAPGDITGLLAEAYSAADSRFIGYRCDTQPVNFRYDASGRIVQPNCRSNAGTLFLTATNFIGKAGRAFAINAVNNDEIWNQPAFAYKVTRYETKTALDAARLVDPMATAYTWNLAAVGFRRVTMTLTWSVEADPTVNTAPPVFSDRGTYDMIIELDGGGNVIGGEWLGASKKDHPPFFWAPVAPYTEVPGLQYAYVRALLDQSRK